MKGELTDDSVRAIYELTDKGYDVDKIHSCTGVPKSVIKRVLAARPTPRRR